MKVMCDLGPMNGLQDVPDEGIAGIAKDEFGRDHFTSVNGDLYYLTESETDEEVPIFRWNPPTARV